MADTRGVRAGRAYVELGTSDKLTAGLKRAQARLNAFAAGVRKIGIGLAKASAAAVIPLALSMKVFANFEQRMARVQALTGATGAQFNSLAAEAKRLGETTVFSASQAAEAMGFFALAGFKTDEILKAMAPTLNLAAAGQLEIAQAADISAKIMSGMGIAAGDLGGAVDVLTKAMTTANTDLLQLGDAMKFVGPIAKAAGISLEEITASIQLLSNAGIQAEMAGTTMRGAILSLIGPTPEAAAKLKELGVSVLDAQKNVRPLADIFGQLEQALAGMGSGEKLDILNTLFEKRQAAGAAVLIDKGAQALRDYTAALQNSGGTAARVAGVQLNTLTGDVIILKSALEGLAIAIGESIGPPLRVGVQAITKMVGAVTTWIRANREIVVMVAVVATGVGALGASLLGIAVTAKIASFVIGGLIGVLAVAKAILGSVAVVAAALVTPLGASVAVFAGIAAAITYYTGAAGKAVNWIMQKFTDLTRVVHDVLDSVVNALRAGDTQAAAAVMWAALQVAWASGAAFLRDIWFTIEATAIDVVARIGEGWIRTVADIKAAFASLTAYIASQEAASAWDAFIANLETGAIELQRRLGLLTDAEALRFKSEIAQDYAAKQKQNAQNLAPYSDVYGAMLDDIESKQNETIAKLRAAAGTATDSAGVKLTEARDALSKAEAALRGAQRTAAAVPIPPRPDLEAMQRQLDDFAVEFGAGGSTVGSFNAAALRGTLRDPASETARNTAEMLRIMKRRRFRGIFV